ncbi:MAG TPA: tetratricopeptide repeat protein [Pyrinomonadaceae bacterium]|jgi:tetratricopeptide (TPR) repeat protein
MGFDKTKVIRAAEKFLSQGKIPAAIKEYEKIVDEDPDDFTALNMLGDLYARIGDKQEAAKCFALIAEHYREQGFNLKAIAMYKKIDRLQPGTPEMAAKLAPLYEAQGLIVEARSSYLILAESYTRANQSQKSLEILRKIADLDPSNIEVRLKLADSFQRAGFKTDAAEAFKQAGAQLLARKKTERALEAYAKALEIIAEDREALSGLVAAHRQHGSAEEAAEVLERALSKQPDDVELLSMLASTYVEAEDAKAAERATYELIRRETTSYARFVDVAYLYLKKNDVDAAVRVIASITEQMLASGEDAQLAELLNEALARNPEQMEALNLLFRLHTWHQDEEGMRLTLERLVETSHAAKLPDEERRALSHLVRLAPDEEHYRRRLDELGGSLEERMAEQDYAAETAARQDVPTFESFMLVNDEQASTEETSQQEAGSAQAPPMEFEWNSVAKEEPASDPSSSFADLNDWTDTAGADSQPASTGFNEFDLGAAPAAEAPTATSEPDAAVKAEHGAVLQQELESVDFYIAQGYTDIALDTLGMIERQFGASPEIEARRQQLQSAIASAPSSNEAAPSTPQAPVQTSEEVEFTDFARYDVAEEAPQAAVDDAAEVDAAFASLSDGTEQVISTAAQGTESTAPAKHGIDPGLAAVFDEFRIAVEDESATPTDGDYETHYNLGLAYKEMDLVDEAVEEFQMAAGMVTPQDGTPRYLQCCNLLGHCFMQKGIPRLAAMWFKKGLDAPGHSEDEYQALRYELGMAYEQMGELDKAIDVFTEVYGVNISYRGVADKLRELQAQKTSQ